ncbi:MAG: sensor histidine kinase [Yoonia sp.]|nr:sensor histidine kinase [Yoonia sp.]
MTGKVRSLGSLRNRLALTLIGGAAVLAVLLYFVVRSYAVQIAQQGQDSILRASVTSILDAAVLRDGQLEVDFPYASLAMLGTDSDDRVFYAIYQDDVLVSGYDGLPVAASDSGMVTVTFDGVEVRTTTASRLLVGAQSRTRVTVTVAQTQDLLAVTLSAISRNIALFGAGFFVLVMLLAVLATSSAIGPLARLTTSVARRGPHDLRPVVSPVPSEMVPLVSSLNTLMARLGQSLNRSEDFIAEAAHRVRTPLATVRSHAETTLQRVNREENRQALRSMIRAIDESSRAAGQLLDHAMITFRADHLDQQDIPLAALVEDLIMRLGPVADMRDVEFRTALDPDVTLKGDPILLHNALRNVVDNALKYAPRESVIEIDVTANPPCVVIRDHGPGFPVDQISNLSDRFTRGRNAEGIIGSGLGLTIAQEVATAHGGQMTLGTHSKGGACVTFSF